MWNMRTACGIQSTGFLQLNICRRGKDKISYMNDVTEVASTRADFRHGHRAMCFSTRPLGQPILTELVVDDLVARSYARSSFSVGA